MRMMSLRALVTASVLGASAGRVIAQPLDTGFTYQGELAASGTPANGTYDLRFRLYTAATLGSQLGSTLCVDNVTITNGKFSVVLDFGAQYAGQQRFLEVDVRQDTGLSCADGTGYTTLAPRQNLRVSPNAAYSMTAGAAQTAGSAATATTATTATNATQLNGQAASFYQNAANLTSGSLPDARLLGTYSGAVTFSNAANALSGNGVNLTNVNAAQLGGQLPAAYGRLASVQTWTAANTFSAAGNSFTGSGTGLTGVNAAQLGGILPGGFGQLAAAQVWAGANTFGSAANSFTGNGSGLTNVNAAQLGGQPPAAYGRLATSQLWSAANTFSNLGNIFAGTFSGSGAGLSSVNAETLDTLDSSSFGQLAASQAWAGANTFGNAANSFTGSGAGLTNVNAAQLGGQVPAAYGRLTAAQAWTGANGFSNPGNVFVGGGAGLSGVNAALLGGLPSSAFLQAVPNPLTLVGTPGFDQAVISAQSADGQLTSAAITARLTGGHNGGASAIRAIADGAGPSPTTAIDAVQTGIGTAVSGSADGSTSRGVRGSSVHGVGVLAESTSGRALQVDGKSQFNAPVEFYDGVNLSIGAGPNPVFPIQFDDFLGEKISFFGTSQFNHYGMGIQAGTLQIYTDVPASGVAIGFNGSSTFSENIRFVGTEIQFRRDNSDTIVKIDGPYDMTFGMDRNANNNNSWFRFFTNNRLIEQLRITDDDEAPAYFDGAVNANGIDYAEAFKTLDPSLEAGDVVVVGKAGNWEHASRSDTPYDPAAIGVVSTKPAFVAGMSFDAEDGMDPELTARRDAARAAGDDALEKELTSQMRALVARAYRPVAFMGRVPVKVTGPIRVGDPLTASALPGHAMAMKAAGHSIGIALEASDGGEARIMVMVQPRYTVPAPEADLPDQLLGFAAQYQRVLAENEDLRAHNRTLEERLDRLERILATK